MKLAVFIWAFMQSFALSLNFMLVKKSRTNYLLAAIFGMISIKLLFQYLLRFTDFKWNYVQFIIVPDFINLLDAPTIYLYLMGLIGKDIRRIWPYYIVPAFYFTFMVAFMISIRGKLPVQNNNQVLMLLNGRPIRDPYWGGFDFPVLLAFPLEMIERIEIIRGPGSVLYGTNAFSGIVNVITKENIKNTSINMGGGSFGNHFISMAQGTSKGKLHGAVLGQ